jgi:hypothetical protein
MPHSQLPELRGILDNLIVRLLASDFQCPVVFQALHVLENLFDAADHPAIAAIVPVFFDAVLDLGHAVDSDRAAALAAIDRIGVCLAMLIAGVETIRDHDSDHE